ncbi:hypothetical protein [Enterococcus sp. LJL51]|uniref:hypothetical protein n=1 Tax=Enterococcus sp. LJL51 TaxID=3416656 RepID=UPI003CF0859F
MVKMEIGQEQTQTSGIVSYASKVQSATSGLASAGAGMGIAVGLSGAAFDSIKSYMGEVYPALAKGLELLGEAVETANKEYTEGYLAEVSSDSLDSEELDQEITEAKSRLDAWKGEKNKLQAMKKEDKKFDSLGIGMAIINRMIGNNQDKVNELEKKREKLLNFEAKSTAYFSGVNAEISIMTTALTSIGMNDDGTLGAGAWNGQGFDLEKNYWINVINRKWDTKFKKEEVFGDTLGKFGADQGSLANRLKKLLEDEVGGATPKIRQKAKEDIEELLVMAERVTGVKRNKEELFNYFSKLKSEGCGYAAATNIILLKYKGREAAFKNDYGISYYTSDGMTNFEELLLSFYYQENDWRDLPFTTKQLPLIHPGVMSGDLNSNIQHFTEKHGEIVVGKNLLFCGEEEIKNQLEAGKLITMTCYFTKMDLLSPEDAYDYEDESAKMHTVMITGYDQDKKQFIVSSWGRKYYLNTIPPMADIAAY